MNQKSDLCQFMVRRFSPQVMKADAREINAGSVAGGFAFAHQKASHGSDKKLRASGRQGHESAQIDLGMGLRKIRDGGYPYGGFTELAGPLMLHGIYF